MLYVTICCKKEVYLGMEHSKKLQDLQKKYLQCVEFLDSRNDQVCNHPKDVQPVKIDLIENTNTNAKKDMLQLFVSIILNATSPEFANVFMISENILFSY